MLIFKKVMFALYLLSFPVCAVFAQSSTKQHSVEQRYEELADYYKAHPGYFEFDLRRYSMSKDKLSVTGMFLAVDLTASALLLAEASPIAMLPLSTASRAIIRTANSYFSKKKMLRTLQGAYIYIGGHSSSISSKHEKRNLHTFEKFCEKTMHHYQAGKKPIDQEKRKIALKILNINHFYRLILYRLQNDPSLYEQFDESGALILHKEGNVSKLSPKFLAERAKLVDKVVSDLFYTYSFYELNNFTYGIRLGPRILDQA